MSINKAGSKLSFKSLFISAKEVAKSKQTRPTKFSTDDNNIETSERWMVSGWLRSKYFQRSISLQSDIRISKEYF